MTSQLEKILRNALAEDIADGDITTAATVPAGVKGYAEFLVKKNGVIAGLETAEKVFHLVDPDLELKKFVNEGDKVEPGKIIASVEGNAASILTAERTALNFLQRMSGIATLTAEFNERIKHTKAKLLDTRKTAPGLRLLDKAAVKTGGGMNHRIGLYDMFLIKDNHIAVAGSITKAVEACKALHENRAQSFKIEVETVNLEQVKEALNCGVDFIMLDNFDLHMMKAAVDFIAGRCKTEASGGIDLDTVKPVAETGVDFISVGALTHSVKALDISLNIKIK